ncbi:hypothetical protein BYT27DRAFT_7252704 [Phlegmacium glaucopus]|nr:hypothetical protein BYT27DRAFT_7252704 [Phlegmacium glaucopus]
MSTRSAQCLLSLPSALVDGINNPADTSTSAHAQKCLLWDAVEERHAQEVKEAAEKAMREYKCDHPDVDESAIKVDLPEVPEAQDQMVLAMEHEERAWLDVEFDDRDREWG